MNSNRHVAKLFAFALIPVMLANDLLAEMWAIQTPAPDALYASTSDVAGSRTTTESGKN